MTGPQVKISIRFETSTGEYEFESLWANTTAEGYELENIPFYVRSLAYGDIVSAHQTGDGVLEFDQLVRASGHSTVRLWVYEPEEVASIRENFAAMGCTSELSDQPQLVAIDVPPEIPYATVKAVLEKGEKSEQFDYQEGCLGQTPPS